jgi:hypothetical protein
MYLRKIVLLVSFLFVFISCSKGTKTTYKKRVAYEFDLDSLKKVHDYNLIIEEQDSIIKYAYENVLDSTKNINFKFFPNSNRILFSFFELKEDKTSNYINDSLSASAFNLYKLKDNVMDGDRAMFFNKDYGLLNIDTGWRMKLVILKNQDNLEEAKNIIDYLKTDVR